jgi:hypothetical protein
MPVIYQRYLVSWKYGWAAITYINSSGTITYGVSISPDGVTWAPVLSGLTALPEFINSIWIGNLSNYTQNISFNAWEADLLFIFTSSTQLYIIGPDGTMKQAAGSITDLYSSYKTVYRPIFLNKCQGYYLLNGNNSRGDGKNTFIIPLSFDSVALLDISLLPPLYSIANTVTTVCSDGNLMWYSMGTIIYYSSSLNGSVPVLIRSAVNDLTDLTDGNNIRIYPTGIIGLIDKGRKIVVFASGISYNRYELVHLGNDNWMFNHIQGPVGTYTNYFFSDRYNYVYQIFKSNNYADIRYTFNGNDWYRVILADNNPNGYLQIYIITDYTYKDVGEKLYVISDTTTGIYLSIYEKDQLVYRATVQNSDFRLFYGELVAVSPSIRLEFAVPDFITIYDPKINKYIKTGGNSSNTRLIHFQGVEIDND